MPLKRLCERVDFVYDLPAVAARFIDANRPVRSRQREEVADDDLAPAAGILNGLMWSTGMWAVGVVACWYAINAS